MVLLSGFAILAVRISYVGLGNLSLAYRIVFGIKLLAGLALIGLAHAAYARLAGADDDDRAAILAVAPKLAIAVAVVVMLLGIALHRL